MKKYNVKIDHFSQVIPDYVVSNAEVGDKIRLHKLANELGPVAYNQLELDERLRLAQERYPLAMDRFEINTMIRQRHHFGSNVSLVTKATEVLQKALAEANVPAIELDFIIVSTVTASWQTGCLKTPTVGSQVQEAVGAWNAWAYDMMAACSGWIYPLQQAAAFIHSGMAKRGAIINIEMWEAFLDYTNEKSSTLLGDAAAVTILSWSDEPGIYDLVCEGNRPGLGIGSDGITVGYAPKYYPEGDMFEPVTGPTVRSHKPQQEGCFALKGKAVYAAGIREMSRCTVLNQEACKALRGQDPDWYVYHQANGSMLNKIIEELSIPPEKHLYNLDRFANTAGATIPTVLAERWKEMKSGDLVSVVVFGGGVTGGRVLLRHA